MPLSIAGKKPRRFFHQFAVPGHDAEAAAPLCIKVGEVICQQIKFLTIHQHHLAVIADQVVRGTGHRDSFFQEPHFQLAQVLLSTAIGKRDQRMDKDASLGGVFQRVLDLRLVEAKNNDFNAFLCPFDGFKQGRGAIRRLNNQLQ